MHHIIINPHAGEKKTKKLIEKIKGLFQKGGVETQVHLTTRAKEAQEIAKNLSVAGEKEFVVVGGDGTLHEVLNGLHEPTNCRVGLIPAGTGNDFAAAAQIPTKIEDAVALILKGETKSTDYLDVGGVRCMNVAGMGIDVEVLKRCESGKMHGKIKYVLSLLQSVISFKGYSITVENDGEKVEKNCLIGAVCNGKQIGSGLRICPNADIADGKLNVVTVDYLGSIWKILGAFKALMSGKILEYKATKSFLCDRVKVYSDEPRTLQLDGELYENLEFDVTVCSGLQMYR